MSGYSQSNTAITKSPDEFAEQKKKILKGHQAEVIKVKDKIKDLEKVVTELKISTKAMGQAHAEHLSSLMGESDVKLKEIRGRIATAESKFDLVNQSVEARLKYRKTLLDDFYDLTAKFENEQAEFAQKQAESEAVRSANLKREAELNNQLHTLQKEIGAFRIKRDTTTEDIVNRLRAVELRENKVKTRAGNLASRELESESIREKALKLKEEAEALMVLSQIAEGAKAEHETNKAETKALNDNINLRDQDLIERERAYKVLGRALANKEALLRRRERLLKEAEQKIEGSK